MGVATPRVEVSHEELFADHIGQRWSPATLVVTWPGDGPLPVPSIRVKVIALAHADMKREQLEREHLQAAHDVLTAALLGIERMMESPKPMPTLWRHLTISDE